MEASNIEKWMAMRKARSTKVKRALFAPITVEDRKRTAQHIADMTALLHANAKRTYNFDFVKEEPLEGRLQWELTVAPFAYHSRVHPPTTTTKETELRSRHPAAMGLDFSSPTRANDNCDTLADTTPNHDSGVSFTDTSDEENINTSLTSCSPSAASSPRLCNIQRKIPDYFRSRKPRSLRSVKRLQ